MDDSDRTAIHEVGEGLHSPRGLLSHTILVENVNRNAIMPYSIMECIFTLTSLTIWGAGDGTADHLDCKSWHHYNPQCENVYSRR